MRTAFLLIYFVLLTQAVWANGGPLDGSAVYSTGDIILINRPNIKLLSEDLNITIEGNYSVVKAKYVLQNKEYGSAALTYGFPVDIARSEIQYELEWNPKYVPEIAFYLDGEALPVVHQVDYDIKKKSDVEKAGLWEDIRRSWHVVNFNIKKNATVTLEVAYKIMNQFEDWEYTKSRFAEYSPRRLRYDFTPAKHWGNGTVSSFEVTVDAKSLYNPQKYLALHGLDFIENDGTYSFSAQNFDLQGALDLVLTYDNSVQKHSEQVWGRMNKPFEVKSISASSQLAGDYSVENLLDGDLSTAWVEGVEGTGVGESVVLEFDNQPWGGLAIINGYPKSEGTYTTNGRIKKLRLEVEHCYYGETSNVRTFEQEFTFEDRPYIPLSEDNLFEVLEVLHEIGDVPDLLQKITLTILEVHPGSKYTDTCLAEIIIL
ncbi:MAG TPA: hypothetical protein DCE41_00730 [Cytophagales bacterium]|nr:hypothetical protein [Cytophagales bacterium]HAA23876.1 hypothetical protein [Cytophagales bacterium]HAP64024.1 hypothetical protein [Cytophagales bacterium]